MGLLCFVFWGVFLGETKAQFSNLKERVINARIPLQKIDTFTVVAPLLSAGDALSGEALDLKFFSLHNNYLRIDTAALLATHPGCRQVMIRYRALPFDLGLRVSRLDTLAIRKRYREDLVEFDYEPYQPEKPLWEQGGLSSSGAYTRGLSFGNSQNLVFNSNLNLQLNGKLGNDLEMTAALSDNSIPLQPDGTTRQLQEFDRIFIQLKRKNATLTAGDFDLTRPEGYFSQYFKRLQGAMLNLQGTGDKAWQRPSARLAAAVSRGKFFRQTIQGQEGNQGPYRLQGAEGERFIIVLAGTEKVYADGRLLQRGLEDDYTIDYNLGELTFTARRLITKDVRIIVEFEYAVQNYLRSTVAGNLGWQWKQNRVYLNLYSEQDSRNNSGAKDLSQAERSRLAQIGDNLEQAYASGIDTLSAFDPARVLYRQVDTMVCGQLRQILVYSTHTDSAKYAARFTEVPQGQGNYVLLQNAANGRVFRWSAPDPVTCKPTGNFEPVVKLVAPESKQLFTLGGDFQAFKHSKIQAEVALSHRDLNRFSPLGNADNAGIAGVFGLQQDFGFGHTLKDSIVGKSAPKREYKGAFLLKYEYTARHFRPLNPYRPAEFNRDWNLSTGADTVAEHWARAGVALEKNRLGNVQYELGAFFKQGLYSGLRHLGGLKIGRAGWNAAGEVNVLSSKGATESTLFSRPKLDLSKTIFTGSDSLRRPVIKIGIYGERENNERRLTGSDSLSAASFRYDLARFYFQNPDAQQPWQWSGFVSQRNDFASGGRIFEQNTEARELNFSGSWSSVSQKRKPGKVTQQLNWTLSARRLRILAPELTKETPQNTYLGRVDYNFSAWKNALSLSSGYELGSGQSPKILFNYLQVNPGEGQYTWVDRNRDSILQVDEMEIAVFQDQANYIRVAVTTTDYVRTNNVALNQTLRLEPRLIWTSRKRGWKKQISRFSTQSTLQLNRKTFDTAAGIRVWDPFQGGIPEIALASLSATTRNILFINRAQPAWDASISAGDNKSQLALNTGFEVRRLRDYSLHLRCNPGLKWSLEADLSNTLKSNENEAFKNRNYRIAGWEAGPKTTWLPLRGFRIVSEMKWSEGHNTLPAAEYAGQTNWSMELTWNPTGKANAQGFKGATSLRAKGTYADVHFNGAANSAVAYAMLEGLQNGKNYLWSLNLDRQLSKSMQLSLNYEGRKTGINRTVHVARAQVRAVF